MGMAAAVDLHKYSYKFKTEFPLKTLSVQAIIGRCMSQQLLLLTIIAQAVCSSSHANADAA